MKLERESIEKIFKDLDATARAKWPDKKIKLIVIGGATLIVHGMPDRSTIDINFWRTTEEDREIIKILSHEVGIDFDPNDYRNREEPYLQWVSPGFVHMPSDESWIESAEILWSGECLSIVKPPIGVILGSKMAAAREQDMMDIHYIVQKFPDCQKSLSHWISFFSEEHQEEINENKMFLDVYAGLPFDQKPKNILKKR